MSACETSPAGLPLPLDQASSTDRRWRGRLQEAGTNQSIMVSAANDGSLEDFWAAAVENYTSLSLTKQKDKRIAIWGIAKLVRDILGQAYIAGLWELDLEEQLGWRVADYSVAERPEELERNPSWSWTSVKGRVLIQNRTQPYRVYQVLNHAAQPLCFQIDEKDARPKLPRHWSDDLDEDLAEMSRELDMVAERRRKSSASSRHNSQVHNLTSGPNSAITVRDATPAPTAPFEPRTTSPEPTRAEFKIEEKRLPKRTKHQGAQDSRDTESELPDMRIAIQGHIHEGRLHLNQITLGWTLSVTNATGAPYDDVIVDAFPDTSHNTDGAPISFVILALSQHIERVQGLYLSSQQIAAPPISYEGQGIMLRPSEGERCYARTGALTFRHLSARTWSQLQSPRGTDGESGTQFFLV